MDVSTLTIATDRWNKKIINGQYKIIKKIGEGRYGKVLLSEQVKAAGRPQFVAIKTINRIDKTKFITKTYMNHTTKIKREVQIMKQCNHPNVVQLYQVIDDLKYDKILLVLEYCEYGEIEWKVYDHYSEKHHKKNGLTLNRILRDVINGLEYLHNFKGIIHRDLKPSNLLISKNKSVKISDFGVSLILEHNANDVKELGKTMGTPAFHAPELCEFVNNRLSMIKDLARNKSKIDNRIDLWSLGVILYCLIFHELPFNGNNEFALFKNIVTKEVKYPKIKLRSRATDNDLREFELLKDLISKLLMKDPNKRISIKGIKDHDFTTFDLDLKQSIEFKKANEKIFSEQNGLTERIKRFFTKPAPPIVNEEALSIDKIKDMERVDDLLDSYLDDSSDMASIESVEHDIDTSNLLDELREKETTATKLSDRIAPPPSLHLDRTRTPSISLPSAASPVVSIGAGSPSSTKSMYTPTKRFFDRIKPRREEERRTISSLTSTPDLAELEPPPIFSYANGLSSRKNSISSTRSSGLSRITSSSSSLNLNAFLTDDNLSIKTVESEEDESESEQEADSTFILDSLYRTMSDYLDKLD